jgi:hypothetical protein
MARPGRGIVKSLPDVGDAVSFAFPAAPDEMRYGFVTALDGDWVTVDTGGSWTVLTSVAWLVRINFAPVPA